MDAVAAGLAGFADNDFVHKFMQELGGQRCQLGVLLYYFQKTADMDSLRFGCLCNDAQAFTGRFQFCLLCIFRSMFCGLPGFFPGRPFFDRLRDYFNRNSPSMIACYLEEWRRGTDGSVPSGCAV